MTSNCMLSATSKALWVYNYMATDLAQGAWTINSTYYLSIKPTPFQAKFEFKSSRDIKIYKINV